MTPCGRTNASRLMPRGSSASRAAIDAGSIDVFITAALPCRLRHLARCRPSPLRLGYAQLLREFYIRTRLAETRVWGCVEWARAPQDGFASLTAYTMLVPSMRFLWNVLERRRKTGLRHSDQLPVRRRLLQVL